MGLDHEWLGSSAEMLFQGPVVCTLRVRVSLILTLSLVLVKDEYSAHMLPGTDGQLLHCDFLVSGGIGQSRRLCGM